MQMKVDECKHLNKLYALPVIVYLVIAGQYLSRPGLYYDEVFWLNAAVGSPCENFFSITVENIPFPVMVMPYIGALKSWVYSIPLAIFGTSVWAIRGVALCFGSIILILLWRYLKRYLSALWCMGVCMLLATDPAFVYCTRIDSGPIAIMLICKLAAVSCLGRYLESGKVRYLYLCGVSLFVGLYDKANFSWYYVAFILSALLVYGSTLWKHLRDKPGRSIIAYAILGGISLAVGFTYLVPLFVGDSAGGEMKFQIERVLGVLRSAFSGGGCYEMYFGIPTDSLSILWPVFMISLVLCPVLSLFAIRKKKNVCLAQIGLFEAVSTLILMVCMALTTSFGGAHHAIMIYPAPQIMLVISCVLIKELLPWKKQLTQGFTIIVCLIVSVSGIVCIHSYLLRFRENNLYTPMWDPAIYELGEYVSEHPSDYLLAVDWGIATQMIAMSEDNSNRKKILDMWPTFIEYDVTSSEWLKNTFFIGQKTVVLAHSEASSQFQQAQAGWLQFLEDSALAPAEKTIINGAGGEPLFTCYYFDLNVNFHQTGNTRRKYCIFP